MVSKESLGCILRCFMLSPKSQQAIFQILTSCEAKIAVLIKQNGGKHSARISGGNGELLVTHLIATNKHVFENAEKGKTVRIKPHVWYKNRHPFTPFSLTRENLSSNTRPDLFLFSSSLYQLTTSSQYGSLQPAFIPFHYRFG